MANRPGQAHALPSSLDAAVPPTASLAILGSTGSIGRQTLLVAAQEGIRIAALAAGRNIGLLADQIAEYQPDFVSVADQEAGDRLISRLKKMDLDKLPEIQAGPQGAVRAAAWPGADTVMAAITGFAGLEPVLAAIEAGKKIALANKEALVVAGREVLRRAELSGAWILPVDSEHSAIWQCLLAAPPGSVRRLIITCSGGPFHGRERQALEGVTVEEALAHPTWSMGGKITIDSASLMNKAFELIEAYHLFGLDHRDIEVVVHRQSLVHSLVEFSDGVLMAALGEPDMTVPIRFALTFPRRSDRVNPSPFDFFKAGNSNLTFEPVREDVFPSLAMAREAFESGGLMPLVLNAANEAAVSRFLKGTIAFTDIFSLARRALDQFSHLAATEASSFDVMMGAHRQVLEFVDPAGDSSTDLQERL